MHDFTSSSDREPQKIKKLLEALVVMLVVANPVNPVKAQPLEGSSLTLDAVTPTISMMVADGNFRQVAFCRCRWWIRDLHPRQQFCIHLGQSVLNTVTISS